MDELDTTGKTKCQTEIMVIWSSLVNTSKVYQNSCPFNDSTGIILLCNLINFFLIGVCNMHEHTMLFPYQNCSGKAEEQKTNRKRRRDMLTEKRGGLL